MKSTLLLAVLAGVCVAVQTSMTGAAQRTLGPLVLVAISGLSTSVFALSISFVAAKPDFTGRAVVYAAASGVLGAVILGSIAVAAGQAGVARVLSLVIATQLIVGLVLDGLRGLRCRGRFQRPEGAGRTLDHRRRAGGQLLSGLLGNPQVSDHGHQVSGRTAAGCNLKAEACNL